MYLSESSVELNITQENTAEYKGILRSKGVFNFMAKTMMSCIEYAPPDQSEAGYGNRVGRSTYAVARPRYLGSFCRCELS